ISHLVANEVEAFAGEKGGSLAVPRKPSFWRSQGKLSVEMTADRPNAVIVEGATWWRHSLQRGSMTRRHYELRDVAIHLREVADQRSSSVANCALLLARA